MGTSCLSIDFSGQGDSEGLRYACPMNEWVDDVENAIQFLNIRTETQLHNQPIFLFGFSSGGTAVLEWAATHTNANVKGIITLSPTVQADMKCCDAFTFYTALCCLCCCQNLRMDISSDVKKHKFVADPDVDKKLKGDKATMEPFTMVAPWKMKDSIAPTTITRLEQIKVPVLIMWGESDDMDNIASGKLASQKLKISLVTLSKTGHFAHLEPETQRKQFFNTVTDWIRGYEVQRCFAEG